MINNDNIETDRKQILLLVAVIYFSRILRFIGQFGFNEFSCKAAGRLLFLKGAIYKEPFWKAKIIKAAKLMHPDCEEDDQHLWISALTQIFNYIAFKYIEGKNSTAIIHVFDDDEKDILSFSSNHMGSLLNPTYYNRNNIISHQFSYFCNFENILERQLEDLISD